MALVGLEAAALVFCLDAVKRNEAVIIGHVVSLLAALALCPLTFLEHGRSIKPSTLLIVYLLPSGLAETVLLLWSNPLDQSETAVAAVLIARPCVRLLLLIIELWNKRSYLRQPYRDLSVEQTTSVLGRALLTWINGFILLGSTRILSPSDLPAVDDELQSRRLRLRMEAIWNNTGRPAP